MKPSGDIYALIDYAINLNGASITRDDGDFFEVDDQKARIYYICPRGNGDLAKEMAWRSVFEPTMAIISMDRLDISLIPPFGVMRETAQQTYRGERRKVECAYEIVPVVKDDLPYLVAHYKRNGDEESYLSDAIDRGMLKAVDGERIVGFVGSHPEHALGLLYIDVDYRRQGVGKALEEAMINKCLDEGKTPIDHIMLDNLSSQRLQKRIEGMCPDEGYIYWLF